MQTRIKPLFDNAEAIREGFFNVYPELDTQGYPGWCSYWHPNRHAAEEGKIEGQRIYRIRVLPKKGTKA